MNISDERVKRAAQAMARASYRMDQENAGEPYVEAAADAAADHFWRDYERTARAALEADEPEIDANRAVADQADDPPD